LLRSWPLVLMYHGVIPTVPGMESVDLSVIYQDEFERQLRILKKVYYVLHSDEFVEILRADPQDGSKRAFPKRSVLVTLDDGFQNALDYALPVAEATQVPLLAFISTGHLDDGEWLWFSRLQAWRLRGIVTSDVFSMNKPLEELECALDELGAPRRLEGDGLQHRLLDGMSSTQLAAASRSDYFSVGGHSIRHPRLPNELAESVRLEIVENKKILESITGKEVNLFAYPQGIYDPAVARQVIDAGYVGAFTITRHKRCLSPDLDHYEIPRVGIYRPGNFWFWYKCLGISDRAKWIKSFFAALKVDQKPFLSGY
jgi:peptidoglycan/xylan/chitin deacetylase (PgdA/CDA1 family)